MSNKIWKEKWRHNDIAFHQPVFSQVLKSYLASCHLNPGDSVLVPLCGKSHDIDLLSDSGFKVMGIELSKIAIEAYFDALKVNPSRHKKGSFTLWRHKNIELWCGDIFDLKTRDLQYIKLMYDCTSLTAFDPEQRNDYVKHFKHHLPPRAGIVLLTTETPEAGKNSHKTIDKELYELYEKDYEVFLLYGENCLKVDPENPHKPASMMEEKLYFMEAKHQ